MYTYDNHAAITCCLYFHKIQEDTKTNVSVTDLRLSQITNVTAGIQTLGPQTVEKNNSEGGYIGKLFAYS